MEDFFKFYEQYKNHLHPIIFAAELHERLVTIHPFIDENGRTYRLIMNLILLKHGYPIANIKGDYESRMKYYSALEACQTQGAKIEFFNLVANTVKESIEHYLMVLRG
jgi:Fic family protein